MATHRSPNIPSSIPSQSKKRVVSSTSSSRRPSTSSVASSSTPQISQGIGFSPGSITTPAGSGIPAFRTLRSLLPFGPNKNATPVSASVSPNTSRSPFANFGSVRRSMTKERGRQTSLSNDAIMPVIAIERLKEGTTPEVTPIRRSVSLPRLEKLLPLEPMFEALQDERSALPSAFTLRTPSPGPALSAELSTILEADSSGVSGLTRIESRFSSPPNNRDLKPQKESSSSGNEFPRSDSDFDADTSALDLSTSHLADQVRNAMQGDSYANSVKQWLNADKAVVIIDADEHPDVADTTFNLDTTDPELLALLSPNSVSKNERRLEAGQPSPTTPTFAHLPASRLPRARQGSSFLPRLCPSNSPSPTSLQFSIPTPSPTTASAITTPKPSPRREKTPFIAVNGYDRSPSSPPRSPSSPILTSASSSTPAARKSMSLSRPTRMFSPSASASISGSRTQIFGTPAKPLDDQASSGTNSTTNGARLATRTLRQVMLGVSTSRANEGPSSPPSPSRTATLKRGSLDLRRPPTSSSDIGLGRPSVEVRRGASFDSRTRPAGMYTSRSSTSTEPNDTTTAEVDSSPSPEVPFEDPHYRPSLDSSRSRPSFDGTSRPGSSARLREKERQQTPSLRVIDAAGERVSVSPIPRGPPLARIRKRSMSVQERFGKGRFAGGPLANENGSAAGVARPGSSLSVYGGRASRGGFIGDGSGSGTDIGNGSAGPKMEWLGPRTAKAFRAAGLLDFEREKEKERDLSDSLDRVRDRSGSVGGVLAPSPLGGGGNAASGLSRFASSRSASEYNPTPTRTHSRMTFSEVGGVTGGGSSTRRSSETFTYGGGSAYGGISTYGHPSLMESPTFTVSSSSRDRDTPKSSTSTAPTSVSESFGYLGRDRVERDRDRERERDREEIRELKEKHGSEMGALLGALSDSQRTARVLREENSELRERLDRLAGVVQENNELRQACGDLQHDCNEMRRECADLRRELASWSTFRSTSGLAPSWSASSTSSGLRTPLSKTGYSSPLAIDATPQQEEEYNDTIIIHDSPDDQSHRTPPRSVDDLDMGPFDAIHASSSSTPSVKRRLSNTSSIFPMPPSNMTMLLHDDSASHMGDSKRSSTEDSKCLFSLPPTYPPVDSSSTKPIATPNPTSHSGSLSQSPLITYRSFAGPGHKANKSVASAVSISPTIANFSMVTGSPGSLFLRPEHEILLGDMESLDLGIRGMDLEADIARANEDGW